MSAHFDVTKTYSYIKGMAMGCGWTNTVEALAFAREKHKDQHRKSGEPYFIHPLTVAGHAIALGIQDDVTIAAALLHDVVEDCDVQVTDLPVSEEVQDIVRALTFTYKHEDKEAGLKYYYAGILENRKACIVKLLDRCNNVSTMAGVFTEKKLREYIKETEDYVLPLLRAVKDKWPTDSNLLFVLKYHIQAITDGLKACMEMNVGENCTELEAAKTDIAALIWSNGDCRYCKYAEKQSYSGAERWSCRLGSHADCRPEWRGKT